jgi:N-acetylglucosaminyldiphosphoundecaprenol N-acetyl-beta-D-mannosaminyltransferase
MLGALNQLESATKDGGRHFFCFCDSYQFSIAAKDPRLRAVHARADAVFADGVSLTVLARLRGTPLPERIPGPSFFLAACQHGLTRDWSHFFYGGAPGVPEALADTLSRRFPGIRIVGTASPPFRPLTRAETEEVRERIESSGAQLLWVGLGAPKQELWMAEHVGKINVPVMLGVGAAFDFHSGDRPWAPPWIRRIGMEWAYRTLTGGRRTFFRNLRCVSVVGAYLAKEAVRRLVLGRRAGVRASEPQSHRATEQER